MEVDEECDEMMDRLVRQMAKKEGVTEQLKSDDWLCWLQMINTIFGMVNQKPGMEDIVSDKHILLIDRKCKTDIMVRNL